MKVRSVFFATALAAGICGVAASAAEFTGGNFELGYSQFSDSNQGASFAVAGSAEFALSRSFSLQLDAANYSFDRINTSGQNVTLHTIYHVNQDMSLGAYLGRDFLSGGDANVYGLEAGYDFGTLGLEGYLSRLDSSASDATLVGATLFSDVTDRLRLNATVDHLNGPTTSRLTSYSIGATYEVMDGAKFYGEFGNANASAGNLSTNEAFFGAGFRIDFGAKRGATFDRRGLLDKLPGL